MARKKRIKLSSTNPQAFSINDYYQKKEIEITLGSHQLTIVTKAWMLGNRMPDTVISLFSSILPAELQITQAQKTLILGSGNGTLAAYLAKLAPASQVWATGSTATAIDSTNRTAQANNLQNIHVFPNLSDPNSYLSQPDAGQFDSTIILLPKGRKAARRWLLQAHQCLVDTGALYLAGANDEGVQAVAKDASKLFGPGNVLGYKKGARVYRFTKDKFLGDLPEWTLEPGIVPGTWNQFSYEVCDQDYTIRTLPGVFSYDQIDEGTQMLLECMQTPRGSRVLDIGCGCGIIGIHAAHIGAGAVHLADDHLLSLASTLENLRMNNVTTASVFASDIYAGLPDTEYDMILSNPPFHTRKEVNYQVAHTLIAHGYNKLNEGGSIILVANRFIRYDRVLDQIFHNSKVIKENTKFHVLLSQKI